MEEKFNKVYLDYKNEKGEVKKDLVFAVKSMTKVEKFNIDEFYRCLDDIIKEVSDNSLFQLIRVFPLKKPMYLFGVLFYFLKDLNNNDNYNDSFYYLNDFVDYEIDIFMIVNYLKSI